MYQLTAQFISITLLLSSSCLAQQVQVQQDPGTAGPSLEAVHYYYDEWPTGLPSSRVALPSLPIAGIAVSSTGRLFSNYPPGLDPADTDYTVAELTSETTETPYPPGDINSPPGGRVNYSTVPAASQSP